MNFEIPLYIYIGTDDNELELVTSRKTSAVYKYIKSKTKLGSIVTFKEGDLWDLMMLETTKCDYAPRQKPLKVAEEKVELGEEEEDEVQQVEPLEKKLPDKKVKPPVVKRKKKQDIQTKLF